MNSTASKRLKALRRDKDLTQKEIAAVLICTQVSYSYYENGRRDIPPDCLAVLSRFYGVSVDYILGITDSKQRYPESEAAKSFGNISRENIA